MKWQFKSMTDPGDGIVSTTIVEHPSDDLIEVAADAMNEDLIDENGEKFGILGWIFAAECLPDAL